MLDSNNSNNSNNRYLQRRSDKGQILGPSNSSIRVLCPDCKERLYILPQDQDNYMCLECGQKFPGITIVTRRLKSSTNLTGIIAKIVLKMRNLGF